MLVTKRDGRREPVQFDKITRRLAHLRDLPGFPTLEVDVTRVAASVCAGVCDGISAARLDELAAEVAAGLSTDHPDYGALAARVLVSNLQKNTSASAAATYEAMAELLNPELVALARELEDSGALGFVDYDRDFDLDYFGFKTMEKMYLTRVGGAVVERPQHMWLRVALALWGRDLARVRATYEHMSNKRFTHASPTLFNAGCKRQQCSSCFLMGVHDDSIEGIYDAVTKCAQISKWGGGIGIHVSGVRAKGAPIRGTNGTSDGLVPMLRVLNATAAYVNQGGRRKGSVAVYVEPHHPDFLDVIAMKRNVGDEHLRARDLFYAAWIPDLFMRRVEADATWSFFDPAACPGLADAWGDEYDALYERYEIEGLATRTVRARDVWYEIMRSQIETGTPYLLMKDAANAKSNQQNLGTIKCSNLCSEIVEYTAPDEVAVCNLASLSLPAFVVDDPAGGRRFDFEAFEAAVRVVARNLDRVIDVNFYPVPEARVSNERHRPVGIGVQGLHDLFFEMRMPYDSPEAATLNRHVFESLYYAALSESCDLARELGRYSSFEGSPASRGRLQFDLWGATPSADHPSRPDWAGLKARIAAHGLRNSLSVAPMPTASTANIFGNVESTEPITSNVYSRRTLAGEFAVVNKHLVRDLMARGLWTPATKNAILADDGSVQRVPGLPDDLRALYRTAWELSMKAVIDMAADRGAFVCQSQSMNVFVAEPSFKKLSSMFFYAWKKGLKTCAYYLRSRPAAKAVQVTVRGPDCVACSG